MPSAPAFLFRFDGASTMTRAALARTALLCTVIGAGVSPAAAQPHVLDGFDDAGRWQVIASDGVAASAALVDGQQGKALRLEYDFQGNAGYCLIRRPVELDLPVNYRFRVSVRGAGQANNLEFKLVDPSGDNVWWMFRRNFEPPAEWTRLADKARHFRFAWGPQGGGAAKRLGAIEFAISAATGGKGYLCFDELTFEPLPVTEPPKSPPVVRLRPGAGGGAMRPDADGRLALDIPSGAEPAELLIGFDGPVNLGGLAFEWSDDAAAPRRIAAAAALGGERFEPLAATEVTPRKRQYLPFPDADAAQVRVTFERAPDSGALKLVRLRALPPAFGESPNAMYAVIAADAPRGWYPRYFLGQQQPWTVVGRPDEQSEALLDAGGALEVSPGGFRIEPFIWDGRKLITWADVKLSQRLDPAGLPMPCVEWTTDVLNLRVRAWAESAGGYERIALAYDAANRGEEALHGALFVAFRPFQVLPPWHELNLTGGVARIAALRGSGRGVVVSGVPLLPEVAPDGWGVADSIHGEIVEWLGRGTLPPEKRTEDSAGRASGALRFDLALAPGESRTVSLTFPSSANAIIPPPPADDPVIDIARRIDTAAQAWAAQVNKVGLILPPSACKVTDTFRTAQGHILINADGPGFQPGSRTYERSWIRDGAITGSAMLFTGHAQRVRDYLRWYAEYQYPDGKIPCVVDRLGADPVPEHDSTGEFIYLLWHYYAFTGDRALLEELLPRVAKGVEYLDRLRQQRMTEEYKNGPPEMRACYGLVPESISHEGYSAKPMHSYWDSFFTLRGLKDAAAIAGALGRTELQAQWSGLEREYRTALYDSMRLAMRLRNIDYIPGCVELGDFDATSTAIGLFPCNEYGNIPEPQLHNTFERYYEFFRKRRDGQAEWKDYTPYEIRLIGTFVRLGQPQRAHELMDFFLKDQSPPGWNQWAEVVHNPPDAPRFIGDMPHTWVAAEYVCAVRSMFAYERDRDQSLVLCAAIRPEWLSEGEVGVRDLPTEYGKLGYTLRAVAGRATLTLRAEGRVPPGGFSIRNPLREPLGGATIDGQPARLTPAGEVVVTSLTAQVEFAAAGAE
jgi:hypothetical protein